MPDLARLVREPSQWGLLAGVLFILLMTNACHEGGHALAAFWSGDRRDSIRRRCTLNPIVHFHWFLTLVLPVATLLLFGFGIGGARPVFVDAGRIGPRRMALVALAGPTGNFLFAGFCTVVLSMLLQAGAIDDVAPAASIAWRVLMPGMAFSVLLGFLNLVPLPPLDGSRVVGMFLPESVRRVYFALAPVGLILVLLLWLWFSGMLYHQLGVETFGPGHAKILIWDLPQSLWNHVDRMQDFWDRLL